MSEITSPPQEIARPEVHRNEVPIQPLHKQEFLVDQYSQSSIYDPSDIGLPNNGEYDVLAELHMGQSEEVGTVALIRQHTQTGSNILLASLSKDPDGKLMLDGNVCEVKDGYSVQFGRSEDYVGNTPEAEIFVSSLELYKDEQISRHHGWIKHEKGSITIADTSTNGSKIRANGIPQHEDSHVREHTSNAEEHAKLQGYLLETITGKRFDGRVPIGRDTTIDGGEAYVDIRAWVAGGEAIVVDSKKYPEEFQQLLAKYNEAASELAKQGLSGEETKLQAIFDTVSSSMEYDLEFVDALSDSVGSKENNDTRKVALNYYLAEGKGVCRHMALAVAWLGGELARHGVIEGTMTAEVNQRKLDNAAHEWARYTAADGTVYILDPAQKYFGKLSESLKKHGSWEYFRPGERMQYEVLEQEKAANSGQFAVSGMSRLLNRIRKNK